MECMNYECAQAALKLWEYDLVSQVEPCKNLFLALMYLGGLSLETMQGGLRLGPKWVNRVQSHHQMCKDFCVALSCVLCAALVGTWNMQSALGVALPSGVQGEAVSGVGTSPGTPSTP